MKHYYMKITTTKTRNVIKKDRLRNLKVDYFSMVHKSRHQGTISGSSACK